MHRLVGAVVDLATGMGGGERQGAGRLGAAGRQLVGHSLDRGVKGLRRALAAAAQLAPDAVGGGLEAAHHVVRTALDGGSGLVGRAAQRLGGFGEAGGDEGALRLCGPRGLLGDVQHPRGRFHGTLGEQAAHGLGGLAQTALQRFDARADGRGRSLRVAADAVLGGAGAGVEILAQTGHGLAQALNGAVRLRGEGGAEPGQSLLDGGGGLRRPLGHQTDDPFARRVEVRGERPALDGDDIIDAGGRCLDAGGEFETAAVHGLGRAGGGR